jgi:hypothetical protein
MSLAWERRRQVGDGDDTPNLIAAVEVRLSRWRRAVGAASASKVAGEITPRDCDAIRERASGEMADCERELARLRSKLRPGLLLPRLHEVLAHAEGVDGLLADGTVAEKRAVLADYLVSVVPIRTARARYRAEFQWTDLGQQALWVARKLSAFSFPVGACDARRLCCKTPSRARRLRTSSRSEQVVASRTSCSHARSLVWACICTPRAYRKNRRSGVNGASHFDHGRCA